MGPGLRDPETLLAAWEAGARSAEPVRGAAVLEAVDAGPWLDRPVTETAERAALVYTAVFGTAVAAVVMCGRCGAVLDLEVPLGEVIQAGPRAVDRELSSGRVSVRCPTGRDMLAAAGRPDAREVLVDRCVVGASGPLSPADLEVVEEAFDELAGDAVPEVRASCPECAEQVAGVVDAGRLLWEQVAATAPWLLADVAALAAAYGWTEPEVLALSPRRRSYYLRLVGR